MGKVVNLKIRPMADETPTSPVVVQVGDTLSVTAKVTHGPTSGGNLKGAMWLISRDQTFQTEPVYVNPVTFPRSEEGGTINVTFNFLVEGAAAGGSPAIFNDIAVSIYSSDVSSGVIGYSRNSVQIGTVEGEYVLVDQFHITRPTVGRGQELTYEFDSPSGAIGDWYANKLKDALQDEITSEHPGMNVYDYELWELINPGFTTKYKLVLTVNDPSVATSALIITPSITPLVAVAIIAAAIAVIVVGVAVLVTLIGARDVLFGEGGVVDTIGSSIGPMLVMVMMMMMMESMSSIGAFQTPQKTSQTVTKRVVIPRPTPQQARAGYRPSPYTQTTYTTKTTPATPRSDMPVTKAVIGGVKSAAGGLGKIFSGGAKAATGLSRQAVQNAKSEVAQPNVIIREEPSYGNISTPGDVYYLPEGRG